MGMSLGYCNSAAGLVICHPYFHAARANIVYLFATSGCDRSTHAYSQQANNYAPTSPELSVEHGQGLSDASTELARSLYVLGDRAYFLVILVSR